MQSTVTFSRSNRASSLQRPAEQVQQPAFDRAPKRLGIDDQPAVVRAHQALDPDTAGAPIHLHLGDLRDDGLTAERVGDPPPGQDVASGTRGPGLQPGQVFR